MDKIAKLQKRKPVHMNPTGKAALFRCKPPMPDYEEGVAHEYVVVSAVSTLSGWETYIFPANRKGEITDHSELEWSLRGVFDIAAALDEAGYTIRT